jgi:hypothetical protein
LRILILLASAGLWPALGVVARAQEDPPATVEETDVQEPEATEAAPTEAPAPAESPAQPTDWWLWRSELEPFDHLFSQIVYQEFWNRRIAAFSAPDFDEELDLTNVLAGKPLADEIAALRRFQAAGQAQVIVVENHPTLVYASGDEFVLYDAYVNRSYVVDAKTRAPLGPGPNVEPQTIYMAYHLRKVPNATFNGSPLWKVVDSVQFTDGGG